MKKKFLAAAAFGAAAVAGTGYVVFKEVMDRNALIYPLISEKAYAKANNSDDPDMIARENDPRTLWFNDQELTEYELINPKNFRLKGYLLPAEKESKVYVFCCHGYRSTGRDEYGVMAKFYHDLGYNVFIIDHQAHGQSDGELIGFGYHESQDALLWVNRLVELFGDDIQIILQGISMGCATVMMMTGNDALPGNVKFTVADCGYTSAKAEFDYFLNHYVHIPAVPIVPTANLFNKYINGYEFTDVNCLECVAKAKVPMLFIHGGADDFVPNYMVHELYAACNSDYKDMVIIDGAKHAESYRKDSETYEKKVKEFADKFIDGSK